MSREVLQPPFENSGIRFFDMEEIWKPVPGFEGSYEISSISRVRSLHKRHGEKGKILRQQFKGEYYLSEQFDIPLGGFDKSEPLAYLEQWATNCIDSVLRGHPEKMKGVKVE